MAAGLDGEARRDAYQAMAKWVADNPPFPGRAYREWITWMYKENRLVRGRMRLRERAGRHVGNVEQNLLVVTAGADHIAPREGTLPLLDQVASADVTHLDRPGGHIGLMAGSKARKDVWPDIAEWLGERSDRIGRRGERKSMATTRTESQPFETVGDKLEGRVALVTGGTRGIGAAICRSLAAQGATVAAGYGRDRERAERLPGRALRGRASRSRSTRATSARPEDCRRTVQEVIDRHGRLDILVNNAGITSDKTVFKMTDEDWHKVLAVNLSGAFFMSQAALEHMLERGTGPDHQHLLDHRPDRQHRPDATTPRRSPACSA